MNRVIKNLFYTGFSSIFGLLLTFLITVYYNKKLGVEKFGSISFAQYVYLFLVTITMFGIHTYGTRIISLKNEKIGEIISEIISFRLAISILIIIINYIICVLFVNNIEERLLLILFSFSLIFSALNLDFVFNGLQEMKYNGIYIFCKNVIPAIVIFVCLRYFNNVEIIPMALFAGLLVGTAIQYYIIIYRKKIKVKLLFSKILLNKYLIIGYPFFISALMAMVNGSIDKIIIGALKVNSELGVYNSAYIFINFLITICGIVFIPLFPNMIMFKDSKPQLSEFCGVVPKIISIIAMPILFGGLLLYEDIIKYFYPVKQGYEGAYIPLMILIVYIFILYYREIFAYQLNAWGLEKKYLKIVSISAVLNIILNLIIIPYFGIIGAAFVTLFTELINFVYMRKYAIKVYETKILKSFVEPLLPTVIMSFAIFVFKLYNVNFLIILSAAVTIYFGFFGLFKMNLLREINRVLAMK